MLDGYILPLSNGLAVSWSQVQLLKISAITGHCGDDVSYGEGQSSRQG